MHRVFGSLKKKAGEVPEVANDASEISGTAPSFRNNMGSQQYQDGINLLDPKSQLSKTLLKAKAFKHKMLPKYSIRLPKVTYLGPSLLWRFKTMMQTTPPNIF